MSVSPVIEVSGVSKCYPIFEQPRDRLKQMFLPHLQRQFGLKPAQYYREFWALKDISFRVRRGESVGIIGRNGSGKSTLLQIICGTLAPSSGRINVESRIAALLELGSGFNVEFTGKENVFLGLALQGFNEKQAWRKYEQIVEFADIGQFLSQPVKTYSSGMFARLAFATAVHTDPEILIVDEILAVGDSPFQQKCINRLYNMIDAGVSVLMVSHDAYQIKSVCQKALLLDKGKQVMFGNSSEVLDEYANLSSESSRSGSPAAVLPDVESNAKTNPTTCEVFDISIHNPTLGSQGVSAAKSITSNQPAEIEFEYHVKGVYNQNLSFVVNIYKDDGTYIFGTTTSMLGISPFKPARKGKVKVRFPCLPLVSGKYKFRIAVNDGRGLNILAEAVPVCHVKVEDSFRAVGIVDIKTVWFHEPL